MRKKLIGINTRNLSIDDANEMYKTVQYLGYIPTTLDSSNPTDLFFRLKSIDLLLGVDRSIQPLLDFAGVGYTGSKTFSVSIANHPIKFKELLRFHNIPTPHYYVIYRSDYPNFEEVQENFGFPVIVRTDSDKNSVVLERNSQYEKLYRAGFHYRNYLLVQRFLEGRNIKVGVLNGQPIGAAEKTENTLCNLKERVSSVFLKGVLNLAERTYQILECSGAAIVNIIATEKQNEYVTGVDANPSLTPKSVFSKIAGFSKIEYSDVLKNIIDTGFKIVKNENDSDAIS